MNYPTITHNTADELAERLRPLASDVRLTTDIEERPWVREAPGGPYLRHDIQKASSTARAEWLRLEALHPGGVPVRERERFEAYMAGRVHAALRKLPVAVLADADFWRYLALFPFRWYLNAREPEWQPQDYGGNRVSDEDGVTKRQATDMKYQLLLRTFLWGKAAFEDGAPDPYERATKVGKVDGAEIDVWHSHVVRVQLGHLGTIPHHFIDSICTAPLAVDRDGGRGVEKRLTRMKHNVLLDLYEDDGRALVDEQKAFVV